MERERYKPSQRQTVSSTSPHPPVRAESQNLENAILRLQRTIGNQAVLDLMGIQPKRTHSSEKLSISASGDSYEQEAERTSERVIGISSEPQRGCGETCQTAPAAGEPVLQAKPADSEAAAGGTAPDIVHEVLRSPGQPLDASTRAFVEPRFGHDFSNVRVHADSRAERSAEAVGARAYTVGQDIVFAAGEFAPHTQEGQRLLAHELAHVVQQNRTVRPQLQRQPKEGGRYHCTGVDLVGKRIILHGDAGDITGTATHAIPAGTYGIRYARGEFIISRMPPKTVLSVIWNVRKGHGQILEAYLNSLKSEPGKEEVQLNVTEAEPAAGSTVTGQESGAGAGSSAQKQEPGSGGGEKEKKTTGAGGQGGTQQKAPDPSGTGAGAKQKKSGTGKGSGAESKQEKTKQEGEPGTTTTSGSNYPAKLGSILAAPEDAKKLTPDQSRRLKEILDQMSDSDVELFKKFAINKPGGDPELLIKSLKLFQSARDVFAKQKPPESPPDVEEDIKDTLAHAMEQYSDSLSRDQKESLARSTAATISNKQLKSLTAAQIAEGVVRVDKQLLGSSEDMSKGVDELIHGKSGWAKAAGGAGVVKGAAGIWAILSIAAMFIPGVNIAVLAANALVAGMVLFAAADAQREFDVQAAASAKSPEEWQKYTLGSAEARTQEVIAGAGLALGVAGKLLGKIPLPASLKNLNERLGTARNLLGQRVGGALENAKTLALDNLQKFRTGLQLYSAQLRRTAVAIVNRLKDVKGADFIKAIKSSPELEGLVTPDTLKTLETLSPNALERARTEILADLPTAADESVNSLGRLAAEVEKKVQGATNENELADALAQGQKALDPETAGVELGKESLANVVKARAAQLEAEQQPAAPATTKAPPPVQPPAQPAQPAKAPPQAPPPAPKVKPPAKTPAPPAAPAAPVHEPGGEPGTKAAPQPKPKVKKQSLEPLDPEARAKAEARKQELERQAQEVKKNIEDRQKAIAQHQEDLKKLQAEKRPVPDAIKKDFEKLPRAQRTEEELSERLEAMEELEKNLKAANRLTPDVAEYIEWQKKQLKHRIEIEGEKDAIRKVEAPQHREVHGVQKPEAEAEFRAASQSLKQRLRATGPNYRSSASISYDQVIGEERWRQTPAANKPKRTIKVKGKLQEIDPLDTDHLVSIDRIGNLRELGEFIRLFAKASEDIKKQMVEDLSALGDIKENLRRMRWDANNRKSGMSWHDIKDDPAAMNDMKKFGYSAADIEKMVAAEDAAMRIILDKIVELTKKYGALVPQ